MHSMNVVLAGLIKELLMVRLLVMVYCVSL